MKTAAASVTSAPACDPPMSGWNRIRKTSAFLRKLSLNAEKNWHQNSGAKRRVVSKDDDIATPVVRGRTEPGGCSLPDAHTRTGEFRQKDNWVTGCPIEENGEQAAHGPPILHPISVY